MVVLVCCSCAAFGATRTAAYVAVRCLQLSLFFFQLCAISGRCTICSKVATNAVMRGGGSPATPTMRPNRAPASSDGRSTTGRAYAGRSQSSGPNQERVNKTETEIAQRLAAQERELGAVVESLVAVLEETGELSAAVSQLREMLLHNTDAISQGPYLAWPAAGGAGSDGRSQREEIFGTTYTRHENNVAPRNTV